MNNTFNILPHSSRIWIYQSNRKFRNDEEAVINQKANTFVKSWNAHGNDLQAGATILHNLFIILSVNENQNGASGCSIDKSVRFIKELERLYNISLLDRSKFAFIKGQEIHTTAISEIKKKIEEGTITKETLIFNNLVENKGDLAEKWIIPAGDSWMKKFFKSN